MYFEFRQPADEIEFIALMRLRETVYATSDISQLVLGADAKITFARHDCVSRHFGLYHHGDTAVEPAGYMRVVELRKRRPHTLPALPLIEHFDRPESISKMLRGVVKKHGMVVEGGRLSILPQFRTRHLARFMVECSVGLYVLGLQAPAIIGCREHHRRFYESVGFRQVFRGAKIDVADGAIAMYNSASQISDKRVLERMKQMTLAYSTYGAIARRPNQHNRFTPTARNATDISPLLALREAA